MNCRSRRLRVDRTSSRQGARGSVSLRAAYRLALAVLAVVWLGGGCNDPPPPPDWGMLIIGFRTVLPTGSNPTLPGGTTENLEGLTSLSATVTRVDVLYRTVATDPRTEHVTTVEDAEHQIDFPIDVTDLTPQEFTFLNVPHGFVFEVRFITSSVSIMLRGEEEVVHLPGGKLTMVPNDAVPFEVVAGERTAARIVLAPFTQLSRTPRGGFSLDPVIPAEHLSLAKLSPIALDRVVVGFKEEVTKARIDQLNAALGTRTIHSWEPTNYYVLNLPTGLTREIALDFYLSQPEVDYALPDWVMSETAIPCDPSFNDPGPFTVAKIPQAWDITTGDANTRIAVIDSSFKLEHPELLRQWFINIAEYNGGLVSQNAPQCADLPVTDSNSNDAVPFDFEDATWELHNGPLGCPWNDYDADGSITPLDWVDGLGTFASAQNGLDDDGNGKVDDVVGWDILNGSENNFPEMITNWHGTQVAGILGAVAAESCGPKGSCGNKRNQHARREIEKRSVL